MNHFRNILSKGGFQTVPIAVFGAGNTSEDIQAGIDGETFEINEMSPAYKAVAQFQGEKAAETTYRALYVAFVATLLKEMHQMSARYVALQKTSSKHSGLDLPWPSRRSIYNSSCCGNYDATSDRRLMCVENEP